MNMKSSYSKIAHKTNELDLVENRLGELRLDLDPNITKNRPQSQQHQHQHQQLTSSNNSLIEMLSQRCPLDTLTIVSSSQQEATISKQEEQEKVERIAKIRSIVLRAIENRLKAKCKSKNTDDFSKTAKFLEQQLYKSSSASASLEIYANLSTLDVRLRVLVAVKLNRWLATKSQKRGRSPVLRKVLGYIRFQKVQRLVQAIQSEKQQLVMTRMQACCSRASPSSSSCTNASPLTFHKSMPGPVKDLYFDTHALLNAFEKVPAERLRKLNWDELLAKGEAILEAFRAWRG